MKNFIKYIILSFVFIYSNLALAYEDIDYQALDKHNNRYYIALTGEKDFGMFSSADASLAGVELYKMLDDKLYQNSEVVGNIIALFTRFFASQFFMVAQHEVGGHGSRLREFNVDVLSYEIGLLDGSGATGFNVIKYRKLSPHAQIAINTGGVESTYLMSRRLSERFFQGYNITPVDGITYFQTMSDQPFYIFHLSKLYNSAGHDIAAYKNYVNKLYGNNKITRSKLRQYAYLDFLDPVTFASLYSFFFLKEFEMPMLDLGVFEYLPAYRTVLAPYGIEHHLVNHIRHDENYIRVIAGYGDNSGHTSFFANVKKFNVIDADLINFDAELAVWRQPKLLTMTPAKEKEEIGGMAEITAHGNILKNISLLGSVGYKTKGFILGRPLDSGALIRAGLEIEF